MIQTALAKLLTVKVAAATIGFTVMGGVALAASTGTLPTPHADKTPSTHPTQAHSSERGAEGAGGPNSPKPAPSEKGKKKDNDPKGTPSPSMVGLCRAYDNHPADKRGKALESPAFGALIKAAGGTDDVVGYCKVVLAAKDGDTPDAHPTAKPRPKDAGTSTRPGDKPAPGTTPSPRVTAN
jgi:hypothetical protein